MATGFVAVLVIGLHFPEVHSLKGKRSELAPVKAHLRGKLGLAVAETAHHDAWQRAELVAAAVARSPHGAEEQADAACCWLDDRFPEGLTVERQLVSVEDLRGWSL